MGSLMNRFNRDLPVWIPEIKDKAKQKISNSHFAAACRTGDISVLRDLIIRFWPFVDVFPGLVYGGCWRLARKMLCTGFDVGKYIDIFRVLALSRKILSEIREEEECHRKLWLKTAGELGLSISDLKQRPIPEVEAITKRVGEYTEGSTMFLRFAAVEMMAEAISEDLLTSKNFRSIFNGPGLQWFLVHTAHKGVSHEELVLRLTSTFQDREPSRTRYQDSILSIIDLFVAAGEAVVERALMQLGNRVDFVASPCQTQAYA